MGGMIRTARRAKGFTQTQLGELMGVKQQTVSLWETKGTTDLAVFARLNDLLDLTQGGLQPDFVVEMADGSVRVFEVKMRKATAAEARAARSGTAGHVTDAGTWTPRSRPSPRAEGDAP